MHTKEEEAVKRRQHKEEERPEGRERPESKGQEEKRRCSASLSKKVTPHDEWAAGVGTSFSHKMQRSRNIIYRAWLKGIDQVL